MPAKEAPGLAETRLLPRGTHPFGYLTRPALGILFHPPTPKPAETGFFPMGRIPLHLNAVEHLIRFRIQSTMWV